MLCRQCAELTQGLRRSGGARLPPPSSAGEARWEGVLCAHCGAVLPPEDTAGRLLDKLSQLTQFGLTGDATPLLRRAAQGAEEG